MMTVFTKASFCLYQAFIGMLNGWQSKSDYAYITSHVPFNE